MLKLSGCLDRAVGQEVYATRWCHGIWTGCWLLPQPFKAKCTAMPVARRIGMATLTVPGPPRFSSRRKVKVEVCTAFRQLSRTTMPGSRERLFLVGHISGNRGMDSLQGVPRSAPPRRRSRH